MNFLNKLIPLSFWDFYEEKFNFLRNIYQCKPGHECAQCWGSEHYKYVHFEMWQPRWLSELMLDTTFVADHQKIIFQSCLGLVSKQKSKVSQDREVEPAEGWWWQQQQQQQQQRWQEQSHQHQVWAWEAVSRRVRRCEVWSAESQPHDWPRSHVSPGHESSSAWQHEGWPRQVVTTDHSQHCTAGSVIIHCFSSCRLCLAHSWIQTLLSSSTSQLWLLPPSPQPRPLPTKHLQLSSLRTPGHWITLSLQLRVQGSNCPDLLSLQPSLEADDTNIVQCNISSPTLQTSV